MINLLLGAPGGGKSYEAVAYHVIPALAGGRKVITNLPLVLDHFPPEQRALLEIRTAAKGRQDTFGEESDAEVYTRPFATVECYGDPWRHPDTGSGPLYVIDEAHMCLPREGTPRRVREWYAMHRHELADALLITQSHGKVCKDIIDLVQVCYRVRKATAFGSNSGYIRKVLDGVRGDVTNTSVRKYDKKYFKFYQSHTKSSQAGAELAANDIVPIWRRWPFLGLAACVVLFVGILASGRDVNPMKVPDKKPAVSRSATLQSSASAPVASSGQPGAARTEEHGAGPALGAVGRQAVTKGHPFAGLGIHVTGYGQIGDKRFYSVVMSQNGQRIFTTTSVELKEAGYQVKRISDCAMGLSYGEVDIVAVCDSPQVGTNPGDGVMAEKPVPSQTAASGV